MKDTTQFPTFECVITGAPEDYDSGVWEFFRHLIYLESDLGILMHLDQDWIDEYAKMLQYVSDVGSSIIMKRSPPDSGFLDKFLVDKPKDVDEADVMLHSSSSVPAILIRTAAEVEELMALYIRVSRIERFSKGFSGERFDGLRALSEALFIRAIKKSR